MGLLHGERFGRIPVRSSLGLCGRWRTERSILGAGPVASLTFWAIRRAYLRKPIHHALWSQLAGVRLCAAHRSVDLMPSNDIAQVKSRPNGYVALA